MSLVVDCDSHVLEPADLWQTYLEPEFREQAIRIERNDEGLEQLIIAEQVVLEGVLAGLGGAHIPRAQLFTSGFSYADGCEPASFDPQARATMLDQWQVDMGVLFPTIGILPFPTEDQALASAYCRAYNNWQAEFHQSIPNRCVPIATINWHDVDTAAQELERCLKLGFRGLFVPPEVISGQRPGQSQFDPIWQICQAAGIPGCLHVVVRFSGSAMPFADWNSPGPVFGFGLGATGQLIPALASMVVDGLFDRFPQLKIVSVEAGCGFAAYLMDRLDEKYRVFDFATPLQHPPSYYLANNCYFVAEPEERTINAMMDLVGEDKILWGSDYPHVDSTLEAPDLIRQSIELLSPERQTKLLGDNAAKLFGLTP